MTHIMISIEEFGSKIEDWVVAHTGIDHTYNSVKASILDLMARFEGNKIAPMEIAPHAEVVVTPKITEENAPAPVPEHQDNVTEGVNIQPEAEQA